MRLSEALTSALSADKTSWRSIEIPVTGRMSGLVTKRLISPARNWELLNVSNGFFAIIR
ncbi:hypothetical protein PsAD2_00175 [Pseudovibrio axinellae]|uniref:Uncharacterized protein n=1 Tax=Pseudovibrio axinellae TaxID=989403 RepID=A0A166BD97_9HYPH|nr:hypothetical protein PsAD2_00175 [Pseudovibrio axinellae]SEQ53350.1 hypothetical protein SAMN05421798_10324 [Pseudovibrio axinellae]